MTHLNNTVVAKDTTTTKATEASNSAKTALTHLNNTTAAKNTATTKASEASSSAATALTHLGDTVIAKEAVQVIQEDVTAKSSLTTTNTATATAAKNTATTKATEASNSAKTALTHLNNTVIAKNEAVTAKNTAVSAKDTAVTAKDIAVSVQNVAEQIQDDITEKWMGISDEITAVFKSRIISTIAPLKGGRDLSANLVISIDSATTTRKGVVQLNNTLTSTSITEAATANSLNLVNKRAISAETNAKAHADTLISNLMGGAPAAALDTIKELGAALQENDSDIAAINAVVATKATKTEVTTHITNKLNPHGTTKAQVGLGSVNNWPATSATNDPSAVKYAVAAAVKAVMDKAIEALAKANAAISMDAVRALFPVGHILITVNAANPSSYGYGGVWVMQGSDMTILSTATASAVGKVVGDNTPLVPVVSHTHIIDHDHPITQSSSAGDHYHSSGMALYPYGGTTFNFPYGYDAVRGNNKSGGLGKIYGSTPHIPRTNVKGAHIHSLDLPNYVGNSGVTGAASARLDVRGKHLTVYLYKRTA